MAIDFTNVFADLEAMGFFDIVLPFLLVFTIAFAVINRTQILGGKKNIDTIVSLVVALLAVRSEFFVGVMKSFLPSVAMFMIIVLMFLLMFGIFAGEKKEWTRLPLVFGAIISFIFILFALFFDYTNKYVSFPNWLSDLYYNMDEKTKGIILFVGVLVLVIIITTWKLEHKGHSIWQDIAEGLRGK